MRLPFVQGQFESVTGPELDPGAIAGLLGIENCPIEVEDQAGPIHRSILPASTLDRVPEHGPPLGSRRRSWEARHFILPKRYLLIHRLSPPRRCGTIWPVWM